MTEQSRLDALENRLARLERAIFPQPTPYAPLPSPSIGIGQTQCAVCNLDWNGAMGFVCPRAGCPVQMKATS